MSIISLVRLLTLATAVPYSLEQIDYDAIAMWMDRGLAIITETGYSWVFTAGTIGVYISAGSAVAVAFLGIPRWRFGTVILAWCFFVMGVCVLTSIYHCAQLRLLGWSTQVPCYIRSVCFSLPPFIMFALLRHPIIQTNCTSQHRPPNV